jgi:phosphoribosylformylglycinamidine cyclo-ligase
VLFDRAGWRLDRRVDEFGRSLGEELLEPTRLYARPCLAAARAGLVHAFAHVTGGGLAANLERAVPSAVSVTVDRSTWRPQPVFELIGRLGDVARADLERTFNMGVGMVAIAPPDAVDRLLLTLREHEVDGWVAGEVTDDPGGTVTLRGDHA